MQLSDMDPFTELTLTALVFTLVLFASCVLLYHCLIWIGEICDIILNIVIRAVPGPHFGGHPSEQPRAGGCGADTAATSGWPLSDRTGQARAGACIPPPDAPATGQEDSL